jgi:hypothetical protein
MSKEVRLPDKKADQEVWVTLLTKPPDLLRWGIILGLSPDDL